jgi:hypothetical protein
MQAHPAILHDHILQGANGNAGRTGERVTVNGAFEIIEQLRLDSLKQRETPRRMQRSARPR